MFLLCNPIIVSVSRPVEATKPVVEVTKELHLQSVPLSFYQLFVHVRDIELADRVIVVPLNSNLSLFYAPRMQHLQQ